MAIILRKAGQAPAKVLPVGPSAADAGFKSPFKESFHEEDKPASAAPSPSKAVFKITSGKLVRPGALPPPSEPKPVPEAELAKAGVLEESQVAAEELYPAVIPGDFVVITNHLFPWVKHYQPGDICRVLYSSPTHSHPEDPVKYRAFFLEIVDGPRKGQKPMLFRWEFEPRKDAQRAPKLEGRVIAKS